MLLLLLLVVVVVVVACIIIIIMIIMYIKTTRYIMRQLRDADAFKSASADEQQKESAPAKRVPSPTGT